MLYWYWSWSAKRDYLKIITYSSDVSSWSFTRQNIGRLATVSVASVDRKYASKVQIKGTEKPSDTLILPQSHPDCELVFSKCSVTPRWAAFAHSDKSATTGLLCWRVRQRQNCIDQITQPDTHAPPQNAHDALWSRGSRVCEGKTETYFRVTATAAPL